MKVTECVKNNQEVIKLKRYISLGYIDILEAVNHIDSLWKQGSISRDEANEATKQLARVKIGQKI